MIDVEDMTLVHRAELQGKVDKEIAKHQLSCLNTNCDYFERVVVNELQYSILSHRWGPREFVFSHLQAVQDQLVNQPQKDKEQEEADAGDTGQEQSDEKQSTGSKEPLGIPEKIDMILQLPNAPYGSSLQKVVKFLKLSAERQIKYAWADTVCIDKSSSAELDESIRSMFAWYRDSEICIVYLSATRHYRELAKDPWFTRGWTLQELLAPTCFAFYSDDWRQITNNDVRKRPTEEADQGEGDDEGEGDEEKEEEEEEEEEEHEEEEEEEEKEKDGGEDKAGDEKEEEEAEEEDEDESERLLWSEIAKITGIDIADLHNFKPGLYDIRKRLTWASKRMTTRAEDMAYSLIGIFDVNLSIAYGEKEKAFYRLQVEILQNSDDMSLFDWRGEASIYNSMLASSPASFRKSLGLQQDKSVRVGNDSTFAQTNLGIRMPLAVYHLEGPYAQPAWRLPKAATSFAILGESSNSGYYIIVILGMGDHPGQYKRLSLVEKELNKDSYKQAPEVVLIK
ncbi:hypothetical protein FRC17_002370 [Serendipita sp. 399]|nr:hypothetical protein FRC17_002370 [Serendipita sp. 399]